MKFVYPEFLWALTALAIPVIIHLFNFRRYKKILFSNVRFLKEIKQQTQSKSRLKHLLILLCRLLAVAFLVFVFAQPYIPSDENTVPRGNAAVSVYIDNSFSMDAQVDNQRLMEIAKEKANSIVESYAATDKFQLLTNDFEVRHQRIVSRQEMAELINEINFSPVSRKISEVISRQKDALNTSESESRNIYLLSDFQESITDVEKMNPDSVFYFYLVPLQSTSTHNLYIDSVWFETPIRQHNQPEKLFASVVNFSENQLDEVGLRLTVNGKTKAISSVSIPANSSETVELNYTNTDTGFYEAQLSLKDYPIAFDDDYYFTYEVKNKINVLHLSNNVANNPIHAVFANDPLFNFSTSPLSQIDYGIFSSNSFIIIDEPQKISSGLVQEIEKFVANGGSVFLIPSPNAHSPSYTEFLLAMGASQMTQKVKTPKNVNEINRNHPFFDNVFEEIPKNLNLPKTFTHWAFRQSVRSSQNTLLKLENGTSFLSQFSHKKGKTYVLATSLNTKESNFSQHALFVTCVVRMAELSVRQSPLFHTIGKNENIALENTILTNEKVLHLKKENFDIIPLHRTTNTSTTVFLNEQISEAGYYELELDNKLIEKISFNYNRDESVISFYDPEVLQEKLDKIGLNGKVLEKLMTSSNTEKALERKNNLWKICIILVLIFIGLEIALIRLYN